LIKCDPADLKAILDMAEAIDGLLTLGMYSQARAFERRLISMIKALQESKSAPSPTAHTF